MKSVLVTGGGGFVGSQRFDEGRVRRGPPV